MGDTIESFLGPRGQSLWGQEFERTIQNIGQGQKNSHLGRFGGLVKDERVSAVAAAAAGLELALFCRQP